MQPINLNEATDHPALMQRLQSLMALAENPAAEPVFNENGWSGWNFRSGKMTQVRFALRFPEGFTIRTATAEKQSVEVFDDHGDLLASELDAGDPLAVDHLIMDPTNPIASHLYNALHYEYEKAQTGHSSCHRAAIMQDTLRHTLKQKQIPLSIRAGVRDLALVRQENAVLAREKDPVLTWKERQKVYSHFNIVRRKIAATKARAHDKSFFIWTLPLVLIGMAQALRRFALRPRSNFAGVFRLFTLDAVVWFFNTVRNNIGYSIALAIYGPFTFYFITQPLNPRAMWAVGIVREAYLNTVETFSSLTGNPSEHISAPFQSPGTVPPHTVNPGQPVAQIAPQPEIDVSQEAWKNDLTSARPTYANFLLSTDVPSVNQQDWSLRMSNFKALQIAFEQNMVFAARMGRIEQIETQIMFPLVARSAWFEVSTYQHQLATLAATSNSTEKFHQFITRELERSLRAKLYIWDRLVRFNRDYLYIVMDDDDAHTQRDPYLMQSLTLLHELTTSLLASFPEFSLPGQYERVLKLARHFENENNNMLPILDRLKSQSQMFNQKERFDGWELRAYMQRQWEILFLLQNKAQEAANFGLMAYTGSIRNALWSIQAFYAAKRKDLVARDSDIQDTVTIESIYEHVFHLINLDLVSIAPELSQRLSHDIDYIQRKALIADFEAFLHERDDAKSILRMAQRDKILIP